MVNSAQAAGSLWILEDLDSFFFLKKKNSPNNIWWMDQFYRSCSWRNSFTRMHLMGWKMYLCSMFSPEVSIYKFKPKHVWLILIFACRVFGNERTENYNTDKTDLLIFLSGSPSISVWKLLYFPITKYRIFTRINIHEYLQQPDRSWLENHRLADTVQT